MLFTFLEAVSDDAYQVEELWNIAGGEGVSEDLARRRTREAILELHGLGYVKFERNPAGNEWRDLDPAEIASVRDELGEWGIGTDRVADLWVTTTPQGDAVLRERSGRDRPGEP